MEVRLGVDTLSYHCRLEAGEVSLDEVLAEVADVGASFVQLNAYHLRHRSEGQLADLRSRADDRGIGLTLSGDVVGRAGDGDNVEDVVENHSDFTATEYVEILEAIGTDRVGVFLDLINPVTMLLDPLPVVRQLAPWAPAGHVKDYRLVSHYVEARFHRRGFEVAYCYPGEGVADLTALLGVLTERPDRDSPYLLSVEGLDNHPGVADQRGRLATSLELLRQQVQESHTSSSATAEGAA